MVDMKVHELKKFTLEEMHMSKKTRVCFLGLDDPMKQSITLVFKHRSGNAIEITDDVTADIAIIDLDRKESLDGYKSIKINRPMLNAIGLTTRPDLVHEGILAISKPISAKSLLEAIQKTSGVVLEKLTVKISGASSALGSRIGTKRRPDKMMANVSDTLFFDPSDYLIGVVLDTIAEAGRRNNIGVINLYADRLILVDNEAKLITTNLTSAQVRALGIASFSTDSSTDFSASIEFQRPYVEYVTRAEAENMLLLEKVTYKVPQEIFMWKLGMMTSRGRLPTNVNVNSKVYLRRWPNLTRFSYSDNDMRIISYWVRQATSMKDIANSLGLSEQEVFNVYTAALAAGLANKVEHEADMLPISPKVVESKERGLLTSILKRLIQRRPAESKQDQGAIA